MIDPLSSKQTVEERKAIKFTCKSDNRNSYNQLAKSVRISVRKVIEPAYDK